MEGSKKDRLDLIKLKQHLKKTDLPSSLSSSSLEEFYSSKAQGEHPKVKSQDATIKDICQNIGMKVTKQQETQVMDIL